MTQEYHRLRDTPLTNLSNAKEYWEDMARCLFKEAKGWLREIDERMIDQACDLWDFVSSLKGSEIYTENEAEIGSLESASSFYFSEIEVI